MESKTPRTDAEDINILEQKGFVEADFARELEEELNSAKKEIEELRKFVPEYVVPARV